MKTLEAELDAARALDVGHLADAIESIGFECTRCGACCRAEFADDASAGEDGPTGGGGSEGSATSTGDDGDPHTATVFPDEIRRLVGAAEEALDSEYDWRDVARPMPYGLEDGAEDGETFEWALQTDDCGDCTFYREGTGDEPGGCTVHGARPLVCQTYPFSLGAVDGSRAAEGGGLGTTEPMGGVVDREGRVRAHECEGLGRDISRADAAELAATLKERAVRELEEAIAVRDNYEPAEVDGIVVHDSEGAKRPDGSRLR